MTPPSLVCVPDLILLIGSLGNLVCNEEALEQYTIEKCVLLPRVSSFSLCTVQCAQNRFFSCTKHAVNEVKCSKDSALS